LTATTSAITQTYLTIELSTENPTAAGRSPSSDRPREQAAEIGMTMTDLIDRIRETIERHRATAAGHRCHCGAEELPDHSRHVAQEVVARLGLRPEQVTDVKNEIRYVSALFDNELTILEGAE
jgi:hypothetical protein